MLTDTCKNVLLINDKDPIDSELFRPQEGEYQFSVYQQRHTDFDLDAALSQHADTKVLITPYMDLTAERLKKLPQLEAIITLSTAVEYIDLSYCMQHEIKVINNSGYSGSAVAEHAFALMLSLARQLPLLDNQARRGDFMDFTHQGVELEGKRLGIVGFGHIGQTLSRMAAGFNMDVVYLNRSIKQHEHQAQAVSKTELLTTADVIVLTLPLTDETHHMIDAKALKAMKATALLISISPDEIIDLNALREALVNGVIAGAALDLHADRSELYPLDNLIVTPTRAYFTKECIKRRDYYCLQNLRSYLGM